jgi:hypothetical protein
MSEIIRLGAETKALKKAREVIAEECEELKPEVVAEAHKLVAEILRRCREPIDRGDVKEVEYCIDKNFAELDKMFREIVRGALRR